MKMITAEDIRNVFGELINQIENPSLQEQVVSAWVEGCRQGNWTSLEALQKMPFTLLTETCGISFIEHTIAVTRGAIGLLDAQISSYHTMPYPVDRDVLIAGGLLHDVGKLMESEPDGQGGYRKSYQGKIARHPISGTALAVQCGISGPILNIIACHAKEGEGRPQCLETVLIHQADYATFNPLVMKAKGILIE
jgi:putative nucleotidyltransferase with HDIG domain